MTRLSEKRERNLTLIDYETPTNNCFTFTQEFVFEDRDRRRVDMVLFVNGFPIALIENKSPTVPERAHGHDGAAGGSQSGHRRLRRWPGPVWLSSSHATSSQPQAAYRSHS